MKPNKSDVLIIVTVLMLILLCGCVKQKETDLKTAEYIWTVPDTSGYEDFDQNNIDVLRQIDLEQLEKIMNQKASALLLVSSPQCGVCQEVINDLAAKAKEADIPLCYIDAADIAKEHESYLRFLEIMDPVLLEEDGKKKIFTPELVNIENGKFAAYYIGSDLNGLIEILEGENE